MAECHRFKTWNYPDATLCHPVRDVCVSAPKSVGTVRHRIRKWILASHHLGKQASGDGAEGEAMVGVPESEPHPGVVLRCADDGLHVWQAGSGSSPRGWIHGGTQWKVLPCNRLGCSELAHVGRRIAFSELHARGQPDAAGHRGQYQITCSIFAQLLRALRATSWCVTAAPCVRQIL